MATNWTSINKVLLTMGVREEVGDESLCTHRDQRTHRAEELAILVNAHILRAIALSHEKVTDDG
jgi:hypothetical protein